MFLIFGRLATCCFSRPLLLQLNNLPQTSTEEILACRGIVVSYESIRQWCQKPTLTFVKSLKKRGSLGDEWYLDEVFIKISGEIHYLWRAVDQEGNELDVLVTKQRDKKAAIRFFKKL